MSQALTMIEDKPWLRKIVKENDAGSSIILPVGFFLLEEDWCAVYRYD